MNKKNDALAILENSVYMPDSGLMQNLAGSLAKLSKSDLVNLDLIIKLKIQDAVDRVGDAAAASMAE
jgi:hypothetical protein